MIDCERETGSQLDDAVDGPAAQNEALNASGCPEEGQLPDVAEHEPESLVERKAAAAAADIAGVLRDVAREGAAFVYAVADGQALLIVERANEGVSVRVTFFGSDLQCVVDGIIAAIQITEGA